MKELNQSEMWAIYLMGLGKEIPDKVTKFDLIKIIHLLCKKLDWIDEDEEPMEEANHEETVNNQAIEESKHSKTNPVIINNRPQTEGCNDQSKSVKIEGGTSGKFPKFLELDVQCETKALDYMKQN